MVDPKVSFYAHSRLRTAGFPVLREDNYPPPERLLQVIWYHQRLLRDRLYTLDGRAVRVLHPGFWNYEAGPDFRRAIIQFDNAEPVSGDVEIDLSSQGWHHHRHDCNLAFQGVVLHVVWNVDRPAPLPTLVIKDVLDAPLAELGLWLGTDASGRVPIVFSGRCHSPLAALPPAHLDALLDQAAMIRLQSKAMHFQSRARQVGWDQALWEGLFRALGYKHNIWPMQRLAELRPKLCTAPDLLTPQALQARFLGVGNLLPSELTRSRSGADAYLRRIWDYWWRERDVFGDCHVPRLLWHFHGLRPANHPERRLALASHWLMNGQIVPALQQWCTDMIPDADLPSTLLQVLQVEADDFWSWHWTLTSPRMRQPQPLLGASRLTDLAMNAVLPWLWIRAVEGRNTELQRRMEERFRVWPAAQENSVLRLARRRLLGVAGEKRTLTAAQQQGLLQIVRDFCDHSNALCEKCEFPEVVRRWQPQNGA